MAATARNPGKAYVDFQEQDLVLANADRTLNKFDIYCPQEGCRCKLLLGSAATLVQREKSKLVLPKLPLIGAAVSTIDEDTTNTTSEKTDSSEDNAANTSSRENDQEERELQSFWRVTDMMAFENIGFSKMLPNGTQFLSCADCDIGPLGYHESKAPKPEKEYLIALNRVRYHDRS